jgi:rare lipoprotein A
MMRNCCSRLAALMVSTALLAGCAETNLFGHIAKKATDDQSPPAAATTGTLYKIGKPYQVAGLWYYPREDFDYDETGIASWYGPDFNGKLTANGETFDQNTVTAAHKTLPMPCIVRVTNLETGRSLVVRVNDRGPYVNGRIIDLSRRSAQMLGIEGKGTARVRVQILSEESRALASGLKREGGAEPSIVAAPRASVTAEALPLPGGGPAVATKVVSTGPRAPTVDQRMDAATRAAEQEIGQVQQGAARATNIYVQAGSFSRHDNALRASAQLSPLGKAQIIQASVKGQQVWRVRLGPAANVDDADRLLDRVVTQGLHDARVVVD